MVLNRLGNISIKSLSVCFKSLVRPFPINHLLDKQVKETRWSLVVFYQAEACSHRSRTCKKKKFYGNSACFFFSLFFPFLFFHLLEGHLGNWEQMIKNKKSETIKYPTWKEAHTLIPSILPDVSVYVSPSAGLTNNGSALCIGSRIPKRVWISFNQLLP